MAAFKAVPKVGLSKALQRVLIGGEIRKGGSGFYGCSKSLSFWNNVDSEAEPALRMTMGDGVPLPNVTLAAQTPFKLAPAASRREVNWRFTPTVWWFHYGKRRGSKDPVGCSCTSGQALPIE
jgi:hypothetical protein